MNNTHSWKGQWHDDGGGGDDHDDDSVGGDDHDEDDKLVGCEKCTQLGKTGAFSKFL